MAFELVPESEMIKKKLSKTAQEIFIINIIMSILGSCGIYLINISDT